MPSPCSGDSTVVSVVEPLGHAYLFGLACGECVILPSPCSGDSTIVSVVEALGHAYIFGLACGECVILPSPCSGDSTVVSVVVKLPGHAKLLSRLFCSFPYNWLSGGTCFSCRAPRSKRRHSLWARGGWCFDPCHVMAFLPSCA